MAAFAARRLARAYAAASVSATSFPTAAAAVVAGGVRPAAAAAAAAAAAPARGMATAAAAAPRILIEDDGVDVGRMLHEPFDRCGRATLVAKTAEEAMAAVLKPNQNIFIQTGA